MVFKRVARRSYRTLRFAFQEVRALERSARLRGPKHALFDRIKQHLEIGNVTDATNAALWAELHAARQEASEVRDQLAEVRGQASATAARAFELERHMQAHEARAEQTIAQLRQDKADVVMQHAELSQAIRDIKRVASWSTWISEVAVPERALVSVVLATCNRASLLAESVTSVLAQSYRNWQLVIVDDASTDTTRAYLGTLDDPRVKVIHAEQGGVSRARNLALEATAGDIIAYLDDDNIMHRDWLKAVVHAFERHPELDVLYGARVMEPVGGADPLLDFRPFDRRALHAHNYVDMGSIAHRKGLPEGRFDETLDACVDWDLLLRLTREKAPLAIPNVSHLYRTAAPNRITNRARPLEAAERVRKRHRPRLRVLCFNAMYPLRSETYIGEETKALRTGGCEIAYARQLPSASPFDIDAPVYDSLDEGIRAFQPDALFLHWANFAVAHRDVLRRHGIPYAVRVHSFDASHESVRALQDDPLCFGVWAYPSLAAKWHGVMGLASFIANPEALAPKPNVRRSGVVIACASLPKRNWPMVHDVFDAVRDLKKLVIAATTNEHEHFVGDFIIETMRRGHGAMLQVNLESPQVYEAMKHSSVSLYTMSGHAFGNPMSVVESMMTGCCVILPNTPEARAFAGPSARYFDSSAEIVRHIRACEAGGPAIEEERAANRAWSLARHADPAIASDFVLQFVDNLWAWRERAHGSARLTPHASSNELLGPCG